MSEGDYAAAIASYDALLERSPAHAEAVAGRAWAALLQRSADLDPELALAAAESAPDDVQAQTAAADAEVLSERIDEAIARLVDYVRRSAGEDRDTARVHLLGLFDALDPDDPRIVAAGDPCRTRCSEPHESRRGPLGWRTVAVRTSFTTLRDHLEGSVVRGGERGQFKECTSPSDAQDGSTCEALHGGWPTLLELTMSQRALRR
jgi:hypothetical protein